jgi:hypothetical protein
MKLVSQTVSLLFVIVGLTVNYAYAADAPTPENIALGKRYTMSPQPGYRDTADEGDATQLTDGEYSSGYFWVQKSTVGWVRDPLVTLTFDLETDQPISGMTFNAAARSTAGVSWPNSLRMFVSLDGRAFHEVGDLIALDRSGPAPPDNDYILHKFVADNLQTHGRYVKLIIDAGGPYVVVDEIEIWRGDDAWLSAPLPGEAVRFAKEYAADDPLTNAVMRRIGNDVVAAINFVTHAGLDAAVRDRLLADAERIEQAIGSLDNIDPDGFRAILPLDDLHAQAYALCGAVRAAQGKPPLVVWPANTWDFLSPLDLPDDPPAARIDIAAMRGETRAATLNMTNCTAEPIVLRATFSGLPDDAIEVHQVLWTDTRQAVPVAAALPVLPRSADGYALTVPAGMTCQLWVSVTPRDVAAGLHEGELLLASQSGPTTRVPMTLRVFDLDFPVQPTLHLSGWDETDGDTPRYAVNDANRALLIEHLQARFVDTASGTPGLMPYGKYDDAGNLIEPPDTSRFDTWIKRWPGARQFFVFNNVKDNIAGTKMDDPLFEVMVGNWIRFWVAFLRERDIEPQQLMLLLLDEPRNPEHDQIIIHWARAIEAVEPDVVTWEDPIYREPSAATGEMFASVDVLCPNRVHLLEGGKEITDFYLDQKAQGRRLELYSCSGPSRLLDPYSYHLLQAWHCFDLGAEATHFWAFGDTGGGYSWNEYLSASDSYTPLFVGPDSVTAGRHMEAVRESVQDYEYMVMLRDAIAANRSHPRVAEAKALLAAAPRRVLDAENADDIQWRNDKDRGIADAVRIEIGAMLEVLR